MFHRVKPEAEKTEYQKPSYEAPKQAMPAQNTSNAPAPSRTEIKETAISKPAISQADSKPSQKDKSTMSDNTSATDNSDKTAASKSLDIPAPSSSYAPNTAPSYQSYGSSYAPASGKSAASQERRLVIGPGITMSGEIESCDHLIVEGTIEAALKGANILEVFETGTFYGSVDIGEARIAGRFEGEITVNGRLTITSTGVVTGSISYKELEIEAGAVVDGKLTPLKVSEAAPAKKPEKTSQKEAAALAKAREIKAQGQSASNDESELFSEVTAAE